MPFSNYKEYEAEHGMNQRSDFMRLEVGDNIVRIVTDFAPYGRHTDPENNRKTRMCIGKDKGCPYCKAGDKVRVRFLGWVIDMKDNTPKLLDIGYSIYKQIGQLQEDEEWSFNVVPDYNLKIVRTGEGLNTEYQVIGSPTKKALSEELQEKAAELKNPEEIVQAMKDKEEKFVQEKYPNIEKVDEDTGIPIIEDNLNQEMSQSEDEIDAKDIPF